ncbi:hypothetical protein SAMN05216559_1671 [Halomicrobium zhouii]|uniref:Uncharacterized protein n=1 Tax=Halomicrobium zhouii TaxID=767519 RepID=A0A1I6KZK0_9EURY|nr:hypothetical protein [Halomicrobium zhouii]SFR96645.1 hypothetical protein SAMN05216559_1671 [Halomicrobium zhouii]
MSIRPFFERPWVFWSGVALAPVVASFAATVLVRRRVRGRSSVVGDPIAHVAVVFALYVAMAAAGGAILSSVRGIPGGLGFLGSFAFLLGVYAVPLGAGIALYRRYLAAWLGGTGEGTVTRPVLTEASAVFLLAHASMFLLAAVAYVVA